MIRIPDGLDPDDWINRDGANIFRSMGIDQAIGLLQFHLRTSNFSELSPQGRSNLIKDILSEASQIPDPIIRQDLIKNLAQVGGIEEDQVLHMLAQQGRKKRPQYFEESATLKKSLFTSVNAKAELGIIKVLTGDDKEAQSLIQTELDINLIKNDQLKKLRKLGELNGKLGQGNYLPALTGILAQRTYLVGSGKKGKKLTRQDAIKVLTKMVSAAISSKSSSAFISVPKLNVTGAVSYTHLTLPTILLV